MRSIILLLALTALGLIACGPDTAQDPAIAPQAVDELAELAETGLACLQARGANEPAVSYDIVKTESLLTPTLGMIYVSEDNYIGFYPNGTPVATQRRKLELSYVYGDGSWALKEIAVIQGNRLSDSDAVSECFRP